MCALARSRAHLFSSPYLSLSLSRALFLSLVRDTAPGRKSPTIFQDFHPFPAPTRGERGAAARPLFSTANIASPRYSAGAFNLRARTIALCPGTSSAARTARDEERGWKSDCAAAGEKERARAKSKRKTEEERTRVSAEGRGGDGNARWSERENRQSDGGTETEGNGEVSPPRYSPRERMQFKTHTGDRVSSTHTCA